MLFLLWFSLNIPFPMDFLVSSPHPHRVSFVIVLVLSLNEFNKTFDTCSLLACFWQSKKEFLIVHGPNNQIVPGRLSSVLKDPSAVKLKRSAMWRPPDSGTNEAPAQVGSPLIWATDLNRITNMLKVREGSNSTPTCIYIKEMSACLHKTLKLETTQCACIRKWI